MNDYSNPMVTYNEIVEALRAILDCAKVSGYLDDYSFLNARYDVIDKNPLQEEQEQALIQAIQSLEKTIDAADKIIRENLKQVLDEIVASDIFTIPTKYQTNQEFRKLAAQEEFVAKLQEMSLPLEVLKEVPKEKDSDEVEELESLASPFEEIEVESMEVPTLEEKEEPISETTYYSNAKVGNTKNAFAVTEEQYDKLRQGTEDVPKRNSTAEEEDITTLPKLEKVSEDTVEEDSMVLPEPPKEKKNTTSTITPEQKKASLNRIQLIKKALDKAKEKENTQLIQILEQQLKKELESLKG